MAKHSTPTPTPTPTCTEDASRPATATRRFKKPTVEELNLQSAKIGLPVTETAKFLNHYESNGWRVGKNPMVSWVHALTNWKVNYETRAYEHKNNQSTGRTVIGPDRNAGTANAKTIGQYDGVGRLPQV